MPKEQEITKAARCLTEKLPGTSLEAAAASLDKVVHAAETVLGREPGLINRFSKSAGEHRLAIEIGEVATAEKLARTANMGLLREHSEVTAKAEELARYLQERGLEAQVADLRPRGLRPAPDRANRVVDVTLDENIGRFSAGPHSTAVEDDFRLTFRDSPATESPQR